MHPSAFQIVAAAHTPFDGLGELELSIVAEQAAHLRRSGVSGVLVAGSAGEGPSLTSSERRRLIEAWADASGPMEFIVQVGHESVAEAALLAHYAQQAGASAVCAAPPTWFGIDAVERLVDVCAAIAASAPSLPFFYNHIPAHTGVNLAMAPFIAQAREWIPNFGGVKFEHDDAADFEACVRGHGDSVRLLWGSDDELLTGLRLGAHGAIGSAYNFAAPAYHRLVGAFRAGRLEEAEALQADLRRLVGLLKERGYHSASKVLMGFLGVRCGPVRLPLRRFDSDGEPALRAALEELGFFEWVAG